MPIRALSLALALFPALLAAQVPTPGSVLGFEPGEDRRLTEWPNLVRYYRALADASDKVQYRELGQTTLGGPFVALVISSPENLGALDRIRTVNARLADPRQLTDTAAAARAVRDGKTIVLITSSIHSTEVGGHFAPAVLAHHLATDTSLTTRRILDETVLLLVPSLNPDGVSIVARWYQETLGTRAEGESPPELYHHYVGHDNNRDWYAFTQVETQLTVDSLHNRWHPQIVHDIHQQGRDGSRFFVPPFLDPWEPNIDPLITQGVNALGMHMAWALTGQGKTGVVVNATYDAWTPARAYQHYHGGVRILSETASARLATPVEMPMEELDDRERNFSPLSPSWNFAAPWRGGRWTLRHIIDYQVSGALALLDHAARHRTQWLRNFLEIGQRAIAGWDGWPFAYIIPASADPSPGLAQALGILHRGGVEIRLARQPFTVGGVEYGTGTFVVELRQPYGAFAKTLLEDQAYPDLRLYDGGPPVAPYDVTAHSLPRLMGFDVMAVYDSLGVSLSEPVVPPAIRPRYAPLVERGAKRVGLYKSYAASMDEGWTRWIFDTWGVPYTTIHDQDVRAGELADRFDVILLPDQSAERLRTGLSDEDYPTRYAGGLGEEGVASLAAFVESGGTLVTFNEASRFAIASLDLPVRDATERLNREDFYAPGSIFRLHLTLGHSLTAAMPRETAAWYQEGPVFEVVGHDDRVQVLGRYPPHHGDVLLSGWVLGAEHVAGRAALVEVEVGRGRVVLFGFRPQYRGQTVATYPLFLNALVR